MGAELVEAREEGVKSTRSHAWVILCAFDRERLATLEEETGQQKSRVCV
jgi:hypothetical protein